MNPRVAVAVLVAMLILASCAARIERHTVSPVPAATASPVIIGDGMELRCYRIDVDQVEVRRALKGLDARLRSSTTLVLRGLEYYELDADRLDDLVSVVGNGAAWNIRWLGQSFTWLNMLPAKVPVDDDGHNAWIALPGRTWSTMMEDGPAVYMEAMPMVGYERVGGDGSERFAMLREEDLRAEYVLRPGTCLVLIGGGGVPIVDADIEPIGGQEIEQGVTMETLGGLLTRTTDPGFRARNLEGRERDLLVFLPHFTEQRLRPLKSTSGSGGRN
ncbi:MAG: hypothetical protein P8K80_09505 [Phycisphaerales bacterium]|jgi:hypothetical protein|nr:hypothetical protein [Phycisphaerales bacterium]